MIDPMTCDRMDAILAEYLEGALDRPSRNAAEAHLGECLRCASLVCDLQNIRRDAAKLPVLEPSRDLWEGIAARIETPVIRLEPRVEPVVTSPRWVRLGLAAAGLVAVTAGATYLLTVQRLGAGSDPVIASGNPGGDTSIGVVPSVVGSGAPSPDPALGAPVSPAAPSAGAVAVSRSPIPATVTYDREIARLRTVLDLRRTDLDPATIAIVENSLSTIDRAISDARTALARDPASAFLNEQLNKALEKKLGLLRTVALLSPRI